MIVVASETYLTANQFQKHGKCYLNYTRIVTRSFSAADSTSEETCSGIRDYDSVLSFIDNDILASQQCLSMGTIIMEYSGSSGAKQSKIKLMEQLLNSYGDNLCFFELTITPNK